MLGFMYYPDKILMHSADGLDEWGITTTTGPSIIPCRLSEDCIEVKLTGNKTGTHISTYKISIPNTVDVSDKAVFEIDKIKYNVSKLKRSRDLSGSPIGYVVWV